MTQEEKSRNSKMDEEADIMNLEDKVPTAFGVNNDQPSSNNRGSFQKQVE